MNRRTTGARIFLAGVARCCRSYIRARLIAARSSPARAPWRRAILVLILRDVEGRSTQEVCHALGFQETNVRVLLHRARANVRVALEPYLKGA